MGLGQWAYTNDGKTLRYSDDKPFADHMAMMLRLMKAGAIPSKQEAIANRGEGDNPEQTPRR